MDPLKFSINLVDNVSSGLAEIRRNIEKMKDQEIKVRLKVENQEEINKLLGGLGNAFSGFNLQLPDFGKVISGANEMKSAVKETASELKAVKQAEDALASATAKRAKEQSKLNTLLAAESGSAVAEKVKAYTALPEEVRKRIMEINRLLASPMGQYSQSVITSVEGRMSDVRKKLDDIFGIPQSEIANFRSEFALRLRQLVQARREEIEKAKREVDDPSFQTQVINGIRMRYAGMLEGLYDKVPMGANGTPYSALRGLTQEMQMLEGQYKNLTETRASLQAEFTSLLNQSTASATSQAAAEKAVTDATNAHTEAVKKLSEAQRESQELSKKSIYTKDSSGNPISTLEEATKRLTAATTMLADAQKKAADAKGRYNEQLSKQDAFSEKDKVNATIAKYEVLAGVYNKMKHKLDMSDGEAKLLAFANAHLDMLRKVKNGMSDFVIPSNFSESMREIWKSAQMDYTGNSRVNIYDKMGLNNLSFGDSILNPLEGFFKLDKNMMLAYGRAFEAIIDNYKEYGLTKKEVDRLMSIGHGYNSQQIETANSLASWKNSKDSVGWSQGRVNDLEHDVKLLTQQEQATKNVAAAEEAAKKAAQDLAAAKENLAKAQAAETTGTKAIEAARQKVKESEEAEKKATDELTKAKEALAKVEKENASVGKKKWSEVESMNDLISRLKYMTQLTEKLKDKNLANNTGKMTDYYKNLEALGTAFNKVLGDTPKVEQSSMLEYINKLRAAYQEFLAMVNSKQATGGAFATSSFEKFDMIRHLWDAISKTGGDQGYLTSVQNQMNSIQSVIIDSIRNLIEQINRMKQTISDDNFTAYKTRIENTAAAMNKLTEAFVKFQGVVGKDEGMKNFMTGLGEVINKIRYNLKSLGEGANNMSGDQMLKNYRRNLDKVEEGLYRLQEARGKIIEAISIGKGSGMDVSGMENFLTFLQKYENRLLKLKNDEAALAANDLGGVFGRNYKALLSNTSDFVKQANDYQAAATKVINASIDMEGAMSRLTGAIQSGSGRLDVKPLRDLYDEINTLYKKVNAQPNATLAAGLLGSDFAQKIGEANRLIAAQADAERNLRRYTAMMEDLIKMEGRIDMAKAISVGLNIPTDQLDAAKKRISDMFDEINKIVTNKTNLGDTQLFGAKQFEYKRMIADTKELTAAQEKLNKETQKAIDKSNADANKKAAAAAKEAAAETNKWAESQRQAIIQGDALIRKLDQWTKIADRGTKLGVDTTDLLNAIGVMTKYAQLLNQMGKGGTWSKTTSEFVSSPNFVIDSRNAEAAAKAVNQQSNELERNANSKSKAAKATNELTLQEQRLAAEMDKVAQSAKGQSQVLSDLKSMAQQYLSVYGAQQFINNIIEIGGQLENQRMSIASILGDAAQANTLFEQIQSLAVKSPFGVVELDQYTKQLSAFGFQYNELYDMTKRLADISAGAGTDVGRLALALGHVRAEGALTGYTLRQFAMNNIPMLQKLSEMLSAREGRLVSTQDIRKRVSQKQIGYEDVISVIKGLTDEGGMFYNMQEAISQSTKSKWKNLKDAMDIMYGKMAESDLVGGGLKDLAGFLTDLTKRWQEIMGVMTAVGTTFLASKLAVLAYNTSLGQNATLTFKAMTAAKRHEATNLALAGTYRTITAKEEALNKSRSLQAITLTKLAINQGKLSAEELSRAVAMGKLSKEEARAAVRASTLNAVQKGQMLVMVKNTQILTRYQRVMLGVTSTLYSFGAALRTVFFNPMTYIMVAISAITELWMRNKTEMDAMKEAADNIALKGKEGIKNLKEFFNSNDIKATTTGVKRVWDGDKAKYETIQNDVTNEIESYKNFKVAFPVYAELDKASIKAVMDNAEQFIREYSSTPNKMLNDAFALKDDGTVPKLEEQYKSLEKSINTVAMAYTRLKNEVSPIVEYALDATDSGWFNDSLITNINDYSKDYKQYSDAMTTMMKKHYEYAEAAMKAAEADNAFGAAVKAKNKEMYESENRYMTLSEKVRMLVENQGKYANAYSLFDNNMSWDDGSNIETWGEVVSRYHDVGASFTEMNKDLDIFVSNVKAKLTEVGWDFTKLSEDQRMALSLMLADVVAKASDSTDDIKNKVTALVKQKFNIDLDVKEKELIGKISTIKQELEALCGKKWVLDIGVNTDKMSDIIKSTDTKYQEALGTISRAFASSNSILKKMGVKKGEKADISKAGSLSDSQKQFIQEYNAAVDLKESSDKFYKKLGIEPPEEKNKNKNKNTKAYKDEFAKRWDERIRIMKEAYDWYEKWRKEYGKDTALDKVNSRYADIFEAWKTDAKLPWKDFDVKNIISYAKYVRQIRDDAFARYQKQKDIDKYNNGQEALRVFRQAVSLLTDFDWDEIQRKTEEYASTVKRAIDDMSQRWDNYKSLLEATGNVSLATQLSGLTPKDVADVNIANNMRRYIRENMSGDVDFNRVYSMSERDIQNYVAEELVGTPVQAEGESDEQYRARLEGYKEKVRGIVEALKEWQKLQRDVLKDSASTYAKIIGSAQDFRTLIEKNNSKFNEDKKKLDIQLQSGGIDKAQYQKGIDLLSSQLDYDNGKLTAEYLRLINGATAMPKDLFDAEMSKQIMLLNNQFKNGKIGIKEYTDELRKLEEIQKKFDSNGLFGNVSGLSALVTGGIPGLKEYYQKKRDDRELELAKEGKTKEDFKNDEEWSKADKWVAKLDKLADAASDVASVFGVVTGVLDGFQKGFQSLADMFDALGNEGMANLFSDISDGIGAVTSIFTPANNVLQNAMNGNIGGVVSSVISAPFEMIASPITAFSKLHDKGIERKIDKLREEVSKIEGNTALIVSLRQRELGYDSGDTRRAMASMYSPKGIVFKGLLSGTWLGQGYKSKAQKDMYEYYTQNSQGSGYSQELANLKAERDNYMEQLNQQEKKKKKSQSDIEATKKKIAELDEQIYYYTQDLAKELWGIDFKSWGQQLSDALTTAFENGTNMAEAFKDTVTNILQSLASKMLNLAIVEPMLSSLQETLFGKLNEDGTVTGGIVDLNNMQGSMQKVTDYIADYFGKDGEGTKVLTAAQQFLDAYERGLNDAGLSMFNSDLNTLSNAMQGTTEETSNLLAGYVNALRQDVAVNRILLTQFTTEYWNNYIQQITGIQTTLTNIDRNVALIHGLMSENGALYQAIEDINTRLGRFSTGVEKMHMA